MAKVKTTKYDRHYKCFSGEYMGNHFEITRNKTDKRERTAQKNATGKRPSKHEYLYTDNAVGARFLTKRHYDNLVRNSEVLFDEKRGRIIR